MSLPCYTVILILTTKSFHSLPDVKWSVIIYLPTIFWKLDPPWISTPELMLSVSLILYLTSKSIVYNYFHNTRLYRLGLMHVGDGCKNRYGNSSGNMEDPFVIFILLIRYNILAGISRLWLIAYKILKCICFHIPIVIVRINFVVEDLRQSSHLSNEEIKYICLLVFTRYRPGS